MRAALGPLGRPLFGARILKRGDFGWDVSVLQFLLTRHGVYSGALDGYMGPETSAALKRYQRAMHLAADAVHADRLAIFRDELARWMESQGDKRTVFNEPRLLDKRKDVSEE